VETAAECLAGRVGLVDRPYFVRAVGPRGCRERERRGENQRSFAGEDRRHGPPPNLWNKGSRDGTPKRALFENVERER
jgi:hypothetical protein